MDSSFESEGSGPKGRAEEFVFTSRPKPRHGGSILMAAMIGLAEALGWDPPPTEITQPADAANGPDLDLRFGSLPPLDEI